MTPQPHDDTRAPSAGNGEELGGQGAGLQPEEPAAGAEPGPAEQDEWTPREQNVAEGEADAEPTERQDVSETAQEFVSGLLEALGLDAEVTASMAGETALVDVVGEDLGVLIGRRGQTLDALQEISRTAVQRRLRERVRLTVDVEGYRARRRASLADYGRAMAERARERGTEIELEPMNAYERKIVHDAVAEVEGAGSFSEGEEPNRKVVVRRA
jgi:spoIIIJ-associated protein